jgi:hypothetical protein
VQHRRSAGVVEDGGAGQVKFLAPFDNVGELNLEEKAALAPFVTYVVLTDMMKQVHAVGRGVDHHAMSYDPGATDWPIAVGFERNHFAEFVLLLLVVCLRNNPRRRGLVASQVVCSLSTKGGACV